MNLNFHSSTFIIIIDIIFIFICLINFNDGSRYLLSKKPGCSEKDQRRIDELASKYYSPGPNAPYLPKNYNELKPFCNDLRNISKTVEKFMLKCYTKEVVQYAKIIFYSVNKQFRTYCTKRTKRLTSLLKIAPCINQHLRTETICLDNWLRDFSLMPDLEHDREKIIYGCCLTVKAYNCFDDLLDKHECSRQNRHTIMDFITNVSSDVQTVCGEYTHATDACETKKGYKFKKTATTNPNNSTNSLDQLTRRQKALKFKTPMFVMIDLLDSFDDPDTIIG